MIHHESKEVQVVVKSEREEIDVGRMGYKA